MPVPNTNTFTLQDVVDEVNPTTNSLETCFNEADDDKFDPKYALEGQNLSEFRNYGYSMNIGSQLDNLEVVSGTLYDHAWLEGDPDLNWVYLCYGDSGSYTLYHAYATSTTITAGYSLSLSNTNVTDFFVVDQYHIYVADKYEDGGNYYLRIRWYEVDENNTDGWRLIDTETVSVSSTVYALKDPKITANDSYIFFTNFNNSTSTNYVYRMTIYSSSLGLQITEKTFSGTNVVFKTIYISGSILYLSQDTGSNNYVFSYSVASNGTLTAADSITTPHIIEKFRASYNTAVFGISITDYKLIYITHDSDGGNLTYTDYTGYWVSDIDIKSTLNRPVTSGYAFIISYTIDGNNDLEGINSQPCIQDDDYFTILASCCNFGIDHNSVVAFAYYNYVWNPNDSMRLFLFPID